MPILAFRFGPLEFFLIFLILLVNLGMVWIIVQWVSYFSRKNRKADALSTAKQRYAQGEISASELDEIKKNLSKI